MFLVNRDSMAKSHERIFNSSPQCRMWLTDCGAVVLGQRPGTATPATGWTSRGTACR